MAECPLLAVTALQFVQISEWRPGGHMEQRGGGRGGRGGQSAAAGGAVQPAACLPSAAEPRGAGEMQTT